MALSDEVNKMRDKTTVDEQAMDNLKDMKQRKKTNPNQDETSDTV